MSAVQQAVDDGQLHVDGTALEPLPGIRNGADLAEGVARGLVEHMIARAACDVDSIEMTIGL